MPSGVLCRAMQLLALDVAVLPPPDVRQQAIRLSAALPVEGSHGLRLDEQLVGQYEFPVPRDHQRRGASMSMLIERADSSIRYKPVSFADPEEVLLLPAQIETVTVIRGGNTQRHRITQRFTDYKRFLTAGRVVQ